MYAVVQSDCTGCGLCAQLCPALFTVQNGTAHALPVDLDEAFLPAAAAARDCCPLAAIDFLSD